MGQGAMMSYPVTEGGMGQSPYSDVARLRFDLNGVRRRRMVAAFFDMLFVTFLVVAIWLATLGIALVLLPPLYPIIAFFYNGLTVSGSGMATWGQRLMGLEVRMYETGARVPFLNAAAQGVLYYVSWMMPLIFLLSLVLPGKRCLHDVLAAVIVVRRRFA
jgi:uncharacterized RDD family membrane protein YckC